MAQRLRSLQRGATLLIHHAEATTSGRFASAYPTCNSLLHQLYQDKDEHSDSTSWQQPCWGGSTIGVRHLSFWSKKSPSPAAQSTSDELVLPTQEDADQTPPSQPEAWPLPESDATEVVSAITQATDALERASIFAAKADSFITSSWCISGLQAVHEALGAPWWVSIAVFNIALRILAFPLMVLGQKSTAKLMTFNHSIIHAKKLQEAAMKATSQQEHERLMRAFRAEFEAQQAKHNFTMGQGLVLPGVMILNATVFISIFNGISALMAAKVPSLTAGGAAWFSDLTVADPYYGLPLMCTAVTLAMIQYGMSLTGDMGPMPDERAQAQKSLKWLFRGMACMFIPAGGYVAAGTAVLWVSNTTFGVAQGLLLRNPRFRSMVGLPSMEALREMNAAVMESNASPSSSTTAPAAGPAVNTPLLHHPVPKAGTAAAGAARPGQQR